MEDIGQIIGEMKKDNKKSDPKILDKFLWVMVGGAVWDALWAPVEFLAINDFEWIEEYTTIPNHLDLDE